MDRWSPVAERTSAASELVGAAAATPSGLRLREGISIDAWLAVGRRLSGIGHASAWCLGDWLLYGERTYGGKYKTALEATRLDYQTLRNYAWIARRFELSRRRDSLSFQHHAEVAALAEPAQDLWLQRAERLRWSRNELRRRLSAERRSTRSGADAHAVTLRIKVSRDREQRWRAAAAAAGKSLGDWLTEEADAASAAVRRNEPRRFTFASRTTTPTSVRRPLSQLRHACEGPPAEVAIDHHDYAWRMDADQARSRRSSSATVTSAFPPIADYAFLSDGETCALVAASGAVEWMCLPRMDSPSVFGAILDRDAGMFRLGPSDAVVPAGRRYLPGTMVLETSWETRMGWLIIRDLLSIGPWYHEAERSRTHRRPPTDRDAEHVLIRTVKCVQGSAEIHLDCEPVFDYGGLLAEWDYVGTGYHDAVATSEGMDLRLRLVTDLRLGLEGPRARARKTLREGDVAFAALGWTDYPLPSSYGEADERLVETAHHWQQWLKHGTFPDHPWRVHLQRSALTLKGLSYAPTGAMVAAATTSLPETPGGERNWDYRYTWLRDATFVLWGLYTLGFDWEANDFFYFVADVAEAQEGGIQIMYGIGGEAELKEQTLDHLSGYEHARPVRVGNAAYKQAQHDVWGVVLDSIYLHTKARDQSSDRLWAIVKRQVESALASWREPDRGVWEVRGEPKHFTSSKLMCWVAADRGARIARLRGETRHVERWQAAADEIHADICQNALDARGVFTQHYETDALDASLLLMPLMRFLPADDVRLRNTVLAIGEELTEGGLVLRYRVEEVDDGLSGEEGAFVICSFWLVSALCEIGEVARGRELCERLLSYASPLQLYAEEVDPRTGRHWGNFPQAFSHLALINAVMHVIRAEQQPELGGVSLDGDSGALGSAAEAARRAD